MEYRNLDQTQSFKDLKNTTRVDIKTELNEERVDKYEIETGKHIKFNYAALPVNDKIVEILQTMSNEQSLIGKYELILAGETMNTGESRKVLHHLTRIDSIVPVVFEGQNLREFYIQQTNTLEMPVEDIVVSGLIKKGILETTREKGPYLMGLISQVFGDR